MPVEDLFLAGRYNKYLRNLSQSPWIDKTDKRIKQSVQELIEDGLKKHLKFDKCVFSSSGREDVDVRMLGRGRPFVFRLVNASSSSPERELDTCIVDIEDYINTTHGEKIHVRDLQVVSKEDFARNIKDGEEGKTKSYAALCCCSRPLTDEDFERVSSLRDLTIAQRTPIRVLHRRSLIVRDRIIQKLIMTRLDSREEEKFQQDDLSKIFKLELLTEAGTYIKEFVHGDFGRTKPDLSSLITGCECDLMELDVLEVNLDWPPIVTRSMSTNFGGLQESRQDQVANDEDINELYEKALKLLKDAERLPRGSSRQDAYDNSRRLFTRASGLVETLELFSKNETLDDIATANLKYLLIPAHLATITISSECGSHRLDTFTKAEQYIKEFIENVARYEIVENRMLELLKDDAEPNQKSDSNTLEDSMAARLVKITQYKKMKVLENYVLDLEAKIQDKSVDDEILRDYYLSSLRKAVNDCMDCLENQVRPAINLEKNRPQKALTDESHVGKPVEFPKTFKIVKSDLQKQVFGLGYPSAPSVSVDQFIDQKFAAGELSFQTQRDVYANSLQRYAEQPNLRREQEEESEEEREVKEERDDDQELRRKRNWDEFKDDNPRGSGNRHNMG